MKHQILVSIIFGMLKNGNSLKLDSNPCIELIQDSLDQQSEEQTLSYL